MVGTRPSWLWNPQDVIHLKMKFHGSGKPLTVQPIGGRIPTIWPTNAGDDIEKVADFLVEAYHDTPSARALRQPWADEDRNKDLAREMFQIERDVHLDFLIKTMDMPDFYIYESMYRGKLIGVAILRKMPRFFIQPAYVQLFSGAQDIHAAEGVKPTGKHLMLPNRWLRQVRAYAYSEARQCAYSTRMADIYNDHVRHGDYKDKIWEIAALAIDKEFRNKGIGRSLFDIVLADVPDGHAVFLPVDPGTEEWVAKAGFRETKIEKARYLEKEVPTKDGGFEASNCTIMILEKRNQEVGNAAG
ncbi:hypothetical protein F5Y19DRAFT_489797 [Xylariaceae sp. FL1651]|nr:hypothetical protein F5Y19DRAFT_489797 [Xylariaceae sp. FL1651]